MANDNTNIDKDKIREDMEEMQKKLDELNGSLEEMKEKARELKPEASEETTESAVPEQSIAAADDIPAQDVIKTAVTETPAGSTEIMKAAETVLTDEASDKKRKR